MPDINIVGLETSAIGNNAFAPLNGEMQKFPSIFLLHGFTAGLNSWDGWVESLAQKNEKPSLLYPLGSGEKNAVIGITEDAASVSWNPELLNLQIPLPANTYNSYSVIAFNPLKLDSLEIHYDKVQSSCAYRYIRLTSNVKDTVLSDSGVGIITKFNESINSKDTSSWIPVTCYASHYLNQ